MKLDRGIGSKYRKSVEDAVDSILAHGGDEHRQIIGAIVESKMLLRVKPVKEINASGITGLVDPRATSGKIAAGYIGVEEALGEVYIAIAEETIDTGGQRGCEGTLVHEGRHAYDFARMISSFSDAEVNPLSIFDPTLYELEWEAHKTSGDYMLRIAKDEYITEGLELLILGRGNDGGCFVNDEGIQCRLRDNYGLTIDGDQGRRASELLGLRI